MGGTEQLMVEPKSELTLRKNLQHFLATTGITAAELVRRTGVSRQVICDWLAGVHPRRLDHLLAIASHFRTSIEHLCFGSAVSATPWQTDLTTVFQEGRYVVTVRKLD